MGTPDHVQESATFVEVPQRDVAGRRGRGKDRWSIFGNMSTRKGESENRQINLPPLNARDLTPPPSINILIIRSSARTSYIEISPDVNPIPTTSIAGDCVRAVIALFDALELEVVALGVDVNREAVNVCIHDLKTELI